MLKIMQSSVLPLMLLVSSIAPAATLTMADIIARAIDNASAVERASQISRQPSPSRLRLYGICTLRCIEWFIQPTL